MNFTAETSRSNKPTIGIVGSSQNDVAILNNEITLHVYETERTLDQEHPEIVAIGINSVSVDDIKSGAQLCYDFGCDFIICTDNMSDEEIRVTFDGIDVPMYSMDMDDMNSFVPFIVSEVYNCSDDEVVNRRPATEYTNDLETSAALIQDGIERNHRMSLTRQKDGDYSILRTIDHKFCGILGGAGPLASATFALKCCKLNVPFVLYSNTDAPSRGDFENKVGPSYIEHYRNMVDFFTSISPAVCVITCNTAHKRLSSYMDKKSELYKVFIDIRIPVFDYMNRINSDFVITGTNGTTGVGLQKHEIGLYAEHKQKHRDIKSQVITCSLAQQDIIVSAIVDIKAGQFDVDNDCTVCGGAEKSAEHYALMKKKLNPKYRIMAVAEEMRKQVGYNVPVVLGCTELPLPFTDMELEEHNFIDPTQLLGEYVKRKL